MSVVNSTTKPSFVAVHGQQSTDPTENTVVDPRPWTINQIKFIIHHS